MARLQTPSVYTFRFHPKRPLVQLVLVNVAGVQTHLGAFPKAQARQIALRLRKLGREVQFHLS